MKNENELCEEPEELEREREEGIVEREAKKVLAARKNPPKEGV